MIMPSRGDNCASGDRSEEKGSRDATSDRMDRTFNAGACKQSRAVEEIAAGGRRSVKHGTRRKHGTAVAHINRIMIHDSWPQEAPRSRQRQTPAVATMSVSGLHPAPDAAHPNVLPLVHRRHKVFQRNARGHGELSSPLFFLCLSSSSSFPSPSPSPSLLAAVQW